MAKRKITAAEFNFLKELTNKYRKDEKVIKITGRSRGTVKFIRKAVDFNEYVRIRPGGANYEKEGKRRYKSSTQRGHFVAPKALSEREVRSMPGKREPINFPMPEPAKKHPSDYSGALLAEMARTRKTIASLKWLLWLIIALLVAKFFV